MCAGICISNVEFTRALFEPHCRAGEDSAAGHGGGAIREPSATCAVIRILKLRNQLVSIVIEVDIGPAQRGDRLDGEPDS